MSTICADPLRDVSYVAEKLGIKVKTLYQWATDGKGPRPTRVGRLLRWTDSSIQAYIDEATIAE